MSFSAELHELDPNLISEHLELLHRVARRLCRSREDAEDLVQDTLAAVLKRPRLLRSDDARGYLVRALRNTHAAHYRAAVVRPATVSLLESHMQDYVSQAPPVGARELMEAISSAPKPYRDAVLAIDVIGLSYRQAARRLRTRETTVTTRVHRGRKHVRPLILRALATAAES
jgi:RNA polymerase sigma-70 factor (ECF subfamily)